LSPIQVYCRLLQR